jgi:prepilin-type N-terminal cleavage/methylation domain-containing protein
MTSKHDVLVRDEAGFTLLEIMVTVAVIGVLAAMAIMVSPAMTQHARSESGIAQIMEAMRLGRETAISQRRNVELRFIGLTAIQTAREDINAAGAVTGTTVLSTVELENHMKFQIEPSVADDTPDGFGNTTAVAFGASPRRMFTSEGTFVDANGDPLNGTVFLSIHGQPLTQRAITIFGATGLVRAWRWNGRDWVE